MSRKHRNSYAALEPRMYIRGFLICAIALLAGCSSSQPNSELPTAQMTIGSRTYTLEIANTLATQEKGLMRRDSMPADRGMIFVFDAPSPQNFWMKNTRFDLDIIYITADGHVDSVKTMKAYDETSVPSEGPVKYAIELNAGQGVLTGIKVGDALSIPQSAQDTSVH